MFNHHFSENVPPSNKNVLKQLLKLFIGLIIMNKLTRNKATNLICLDAHSVTIASLVVTLSGREERGGG